MRSVKYATNTAWPRNVGVVVGEKVPLKQAQNRFTVYTRTVLTEIYIMIICPSGIC